MISIAIGWLLRCLGCALVLALGHAAQAAGCQTGTACGNILFDGDSISAGVGTRVARPDALLAQSLPMPVSTGNVAVGGRPVRDCLALFDQNVAPRFRRDAPFNLIVFHAGDNDVALGMDAETAYRNFTQYVSRAHQQGWRVVVSTELPRPGWNAAMEGQLEAYNRRLLANTAKADAVVDLAADPALYDPATRPESPFYGPDAVHPNDAGYARLNGLLSKTVVDLLGSR